MKIFTKIALTIGLLWGSNAWAATANITATVDRILTISGSTYGGCMALLSASPASEGLTCRGRWVSFSCSGDFASRQDAKRNLEMAQLAFALEKQIRVTADDARTHNGYCYVNRVDLLP